MPPLQQPGAERNVASTSASAPTVRKTRSPRPPITAPRLKGATFYTTFSPCLLCTKMIINSGIVEVIYNQDYPLNDRAMALLEECGVKLRKHAV